MTDRIFLDPGAVGELTGNSTPDDVAIQFNDLRQAVVDAYGITEFFQTVQTGDYTTGDTPTVFVVMDNASAATLTAYEDPLDGYVIIVSRQGAGTVTFDADANDNNTVEGSATFTVDGAAIFRYSEAETDWKCVGVYQTTYSTDLVLQNDVYLQGEGTDGVAENLIGLDASDIIQVGDAGHALNFNGTGFTFGGDVEIDGDLDVSPSSGVATITATSTTGGSVLALDTAANQTAAIVVYESGFLVSRLRYLNSGDYWQFSAGDVKIATGDLEVSGGALFGGDVIIDKADAYLRLRSDDATQNGIAFQNSAGTNHWQLYENVGAGGAQGNIELYDSVGGAGALGVISGGGNVYVTGRNFQVSGGLATDGETVPSSGARFGGVVVINQTNGLLVGRTGSPDTAAHIYGSTGILTIESANANSSRIYFKDGTNGNWGAISGSKASGISITPNHSAGDIRFGGIKIEKDLLTLGGQFQLTDLGFYGTTPNIYGDTANVGASEAALTISGGDPTNLGGNAVFYGPGHATKAHDFELRRSSNNIIAYDHSATLLTITPDTLFEGNLLADYMQMDQGTADAPFIDFVASADSDTTSAISTLTTSGATTHHIQIEINGVKAWIPASTNNPS